MVIALFIYKRKKKGIDLELSQGLEEKEDDITRMEGTRMSSGTPQMPITGSYPGLGNTGPPDAKGTLQEF